MISVGLFRTILKQRWSLLNFWNRFWNSANQREFYQIHSETALVFLNPFWKSADSRLFSKKKILKQRWSAIVFLKVFWNDADKCWFFESLPKQRWSPLAFLSFFWNSAEESWFFQTHSETVVFIVGVLKSILKQHWSALVFITLSETAMISAGFF